MTDYDAPTPPQEGIATLLRELGERDAELRRLRQHLGRVRAQKDRWKREARDATAMLTALERNRQTWDRRRAA